MNVVKLIDWAKRESIRENAYGEGKSAAFRECYEELERMNKADLIETKCLLKSVPEPVYAQRALWDSVTKNYVEILECIVSDIIDNK